MMKDGVQVGGYLPISTVSIGKSLNDIAFCELVLNRTKPLEYYGIDNVILIQRAPQDEKYPTLTEFAGFIRKREEFERTNAKEFTRLGIFGLNYLLKGRDVDYQATTTGTGYTLKTDYADDMMKEIVDENLNGSVTDSDRELPSDFSIATDVSAAPSITFDFPHQNVLDTLQKIAEISAADGTALYFDVAYKNKTSFEFRTYTDYLGTDTTTGMDTQIFSDFKYNIANAHLIEDYSEEWNVVNAWGAGDPGTQDKSQQEDTERSGRSRWARREHTIQAGSNIDTDSLASLAKAELREGRPILTFECDLLDTSTSVYGIHWHFGDWVRVGFNGKSYAGIVRSVSLDYNAETKEESVQGRFHYSALLGQGGAGIP